jgi:D-3-phosphoglycerate dehydrogenase
MPCILLTNHYSKKVLSIIEKKIPDQFTFISLKKADKNELIKRVSSADYLLASGRVPIDRDVLNAANNLKMIQRTGVGLDSLDLQAIKEKNIPVYVNQGVNSQSVAEHTILLMLATLRRLPSINLMTKKGVWQRQDEGVLNFELFGKTVGLIGMGNIGRAVAHILRNFHVKILYYDLMQAPKDIEKELSITFAPFDMLIQQADILSLHCPLTPWTKGIIGKEQLASMKKGSIIINTARGGLIDEEALIKNLESGHLASAGLDVFNEEPLPKTSPLLKMDNVILTPHIGGITYDSFSAMMTEALTNITLFEEGRMDLIKDKRLNIC